MMLSIPRCFDQPYELKLLVLAAFICSLACFTTVHILARAQSAEGTRRYVWLGVTAGIFGSGVWSLHFIAMLAFMPGFPISFGLFHTIRSIAVAITGAAIAVAVRRFAGGL